MEEIQQSSPHRVNIRETWSYLLSGPQRVNTCQTVAYRRLINNIYDALGIDRLK